MKQEVWVQSLIKVYGLLYVFYKAQEMTCMHLQHSRARYIGCLVFELLKFIFKAHNIFDGLFTRV